MKKKLLTMVLLLSLLALAACSKPAETTTTETETSTTTETATPEGESSSKMPDRPFIYSAQQVVGTIDPAKAIDETEIICAVNMYDPLVVPKRDGSMEPQPHLMESYEVSEDGKTYTIKLRDGVKFHSGNPLTSADVAYTMERMIAIKEGNSWLWSQVVDVEATQTPDEKTVVFELKSPYAPFIASLTQLYITDSKLLKENEKDGDYGQAYLQEHDAGSGPYMLKAWDRQAQIEFTAFEDYWLGWKDGQIKEAQMKFIPEEATTKTLLISGQADMVHMWMNPTAYEEFKEQKGVLVQEDPSVTLQEMPMNTQKAPTDDINVRKAIASAFDYETATTQILKGAVQAEGPVPNKVKGHSSSVTIFKRDIEAAKKYMAESKYAGEPVEIEFMFLGEQPEQRQYAQLLSANLKEIGIDVKLLPVSWPQITEATANPKTEAHLTMISDSLKYPHVDSHTFGKYHPSAHGSFRSASWLDDPEVTKMLEEARAAVTPEEQTKLYTEVQDRITELAPSVFVANTTHRVAFRDYVKGYKYVSLMGYDIAFYHFTVN